MLAYFSLTLDVSFWNVNMAIHRDTFTQAAGVHITSTCTLTLPLIHTELTHMLQLSTWPLTHPRIFTVKLKKCFLLLPRYNKMPWKTLQQCCRINYFLVTTPQFVASLPLASIHSSVSPPPPPVSSPVCILHIQPGCLWNHTHPPHSTCWCPPQGLLWQSPHHLWKDLP